MHPAISIHWPDEPERLKEALEKNEIESARVPRQLEVPGGQVALVDSKQNVLAIGTISQIEEDAHVTDLEGNATNGCILRMKNGTFRRPRRNDPKRLAVLTKWLGSFYYLNSNLAPVNSSGGGYVNTPTTVDVGPFETNVDFYEYSGEGVSRFEHALVKRYMQWIGDYPAFYEPHFKKENLFADLFIPRFYCLVEAKASIAREHIRMAIGQLFDYHFCFTSRKPSLAILVPEQPSRRDIEMLSKRKISVIWETPKGRFGDSVGGKFTTAFRNAVKVMNG